MDRVLGCEYVHYFSAVVVWEKLNSCPLDCCAGKSSKKLGGRAKMGTEFMGCHNNNSNKSSSNSNNINKNNNQLIIIQQVPS
jgi:hypothetical protein